MKNKKMVGLVFGVVPEWQKTGIEGYMIVEGTQHIRKNTAFEETKCSGLATSTQK